MSVGQKLIRYCVQLLTPLIISLYYPLEEYNAVVFFGFLPTDLATPLFISSFLAVSTSLRWSSLTAFHLYWIATLFRLYRFWNLCRQCICQKKTTVICNRYQYGIWAIISTKEFCPRLFWLLRNSLEIVLQIIIMMTCSLLSSSVLRYTYAFIPCSRAYLFTIFP